MVFALAACGGKSDDFDSALGQQAEAKAKVEKLQAELTTATAEARAAMDKLMKLQTELDEVDKRVASAVSDVANSKDKAAVEAAAGRLKKVQDEQQEVRKRVAQAKEAAEKAQQNVEVVRSKFAR